MNRKQTPGRIEALGAVLRMGIDNAPQDLVHLAGLDRPRFPGMNQPPLPTMTLASGIEKLSTQERAALPF